MWDYDARAPVMLFDAKDDNGSTVPAAAEAGKVGNVFIVNRLTGKLLHKSEPFVKQSAEHVHRRRAARAPRFCRRQRRLAVAAAGLFAAHRLFLCAGRQYPMTFTTIDFKDSQPGGPWVGRHTGGVMKRADGPQSGTLTAIDVNTGKIAWQYKSAQPMFGGVLATASDLVFAGEMNGDFGAFDARTRQQALEPSLRQGRLHARHHLSRQGVQYLAVGANGCRGGHVPLGTPLYSETWRSSRSSRDASFTG